MSKIPLGESKVHTFPAYIGGPVSMISSCFRRLILAILTHINLDLLPIRVLNRRIITLDPNILHELRFSCQLSNSHSGTSKSIVASPVRQLFPTPPKNSQSSCQLTPCQPYRQDIHPSIHPSITHPRPERRYGSPSYAVRPISASSPMSEGGRWGGKKPL